MNLHTKHRPEKIEDFYGNFGIVQSLKIAIDNNEIPHVILLEGGMGLGKTSLVRVLGKYISGQVNEIDSAKNRGIETSRDIIDTCKFVPMSGKNVVYILDEFHQMSKDAQQALLKIFEDTPSHVYFFLCSTDSNKIIPTILNRCIRYRVNKLRESDLKKLIKSVCKKENLDISEEIIDIIVFSADGIPRSALLLLEQLKNISDSTIAERIAFNSIKKEEQEIYSLCKELSTRQYTWKSLMSSYKTLTVQEPETIRRIMLSFFIKCLKNSKNPQQTKKFYSYVSALSKPFFDNPEAQLLCALYESIANE
jgi:DNA polymerase-3 subunit gamma/tau